MKQGRFYKHLYFQVLAAITIGIALGHFYPELGAQMKPLGDGFIKLIKMMIAPIIFCTVVVGIASMENLKKVGRVGLFAVLYFEILSTLALVIGMVMVNLLQPGAGMNVNPASLDTRAIAQYSSAAKATSHSTVDFLMQIIPATVVDAFAKGEILQVLLFSVLFGFALFTYGEKGKPLLDLIDRGGHALFGVIGIITRLAPLGAFGAMAFTIGKYGVGSLASLGKLMAVFYLTCLLFVFVVLGLVARVTGFSIWRFVIKEELLIVLGTSSSESVLPRMMVKLENLGCSKSVVGLVIPTGYSFNLDGTAIYLTMAALFVAQATNVPLTWGDQLTILGVLLLTSKGAAGITGSGFVTLAATLASVSAIPVAGLALILGIDRFMSEARALTNLIGNGVATVVVAKLDKELNVQRMRRHLAHETEVEAEEPEKALA